MIQARVALISISLLAFGFAGGWTASAWRFGLPFAVRPHAGPPPLPTDELLSRLHLDAKQAATIAQLARDGRDRESALLERVELARGALDAAVMETKELDSPREKYDALTTAKNAFERNHFETMMSIHAQLTMEQIHELRSLRPGAASQEK